MKLEKLVFSAIFITLVSLTLVTASHTPSVTLTPLQWTAGTEHDVSLLVTNNGGDIIKQVELVIPENSQGTPVYALKEVSKPAGWTYDLRTKVGQQLPYKIIWSSEASGISAGSSNSFGFRAASPLQMGEYAWTVNTVDQSGTVVTSHMASATGQAEFSGLDLAGIPKETKAGKTLRVTVKAYDVNGDIKTDYTGTVIFGSSDDKSLLPESYKFKKSDGGIKTFDVVLKTAGEKVVAVSDLGSSVSKTSEMIKVTLGDIAFLKILPDGLEVKTGTKVEFIAAASDVYDNSIDVTGDVSWSIENQADGEWEGNFYTAENRGVWTVIGKYQKAIDGALLKVKDGVATKPTVPEAPTVPAEPEEEKEQPVVEEPKQEVPEIEPIPTAELSVSGSDVISIEAGSNGTSVITVENTGNTDLSGVKLSYLGVSEDWIEVYPASEDLAVGESREFLVTITVPENISEKQTVTFTAASNEGASSTKETTLYAGSAPTGIFAGISKNLLQLGVVIIAVATVVIIVWELWFRK